MIVFDENIKYKVFLETQQWYRGKVTSLLTLRSGTVIKDEAVPTLLRTAKHPTFITNNTADFWRRTPLHKNYCLICFVLPNDRIEEIPALLQKLFAMKSFKTKASRMGKALRVRRKHVDYYDVNDLTVQTIAFV